jgi:uridylate kinase
MEEVIVISLGGSLIIPDQIDIDFLRDFKKLIISHTEKGKKFIIITGGGKVCRRYQDAAKKLAEASDADLDLIGIRALNLNAELVRVVFGDAAQDKIVYTRENPVHFEKSIIICGAEKPGSSTDLGAVWLAKGAGAKKVINLSNTDYVYDKDPNKFPDAKKIEKITWADYEELIPKEWNPGLNTPFDPIASRLAQADGMEVQILNGKNIDNLEKCLDGQDFIGTHIK